jgi:hypothetical protein
MIESIFDKLRAYKYKYYLNILVKGILISLTLILTLYLIITTLEYFGNFNTTLRAILFFSFVGGGVFVLGKLILYPLYQLATLNKHLSDDEAAIQIGKYFPEASDKLLNMLQLNRAVAQDNALLKASIDQKTKELSILPFADAVNLRENTRYLRYIVAPVAIIIIIVAVAPHFFSESTARIIYYNKKFVPKAPFEFKLLNKDLVAYKNESFQVQLELDGNAIPENVYFVAGDRRQKMAKGDKNLYTFNVENVQQAFDFEFEAAGFASEPYRIKLYARPDLTGFNASLEYPSYLQKPDEVLSNVGNLTIPQGTTVKWTFNSLDADSLYLTFSSDNKVQYPAQKSGSNKFGFTKRFLNSEQYQVNLSNKYSKNKDEISYTMNVIPDQHPRITLEQFRDTALFNFIVLGGSLTDDYGITRLELFYKKKDVQSKKQAGPYKRIAIPVGKQSSQSYYYRWDIDSLRLENGEALEYYLAVWDNDGVNGHKSSKTQLFEFKLPDYQEVKKGIEKETEKTEANIDKALSQAKEVSEELSKLRDRLKGKKNLTWQDKKLLEDVLKKRDDLSKEIEQLKQQNEMLNQKMDRFNPDNEKLAEKVESLQKLMNDLLDEDTKKLYEQLQKLLDEKANPDKLKNVLDQLSKKDNNLEKELDRALELFKQLKFEQKFDEAIKKLDEMSQEQKKLSEETLDKNTDQKELEQKQEELNKEFEQVKEDLDKLNEMNNDLKDKNNIQDTEQQENEISQEQQNSSEQLKNNQNKKASKSQKNASDKMQQLKEQMAKMQEEMEQEQTSEDLENLRSILHNLLTLSFDQEELMKQFKVVKQSDPKYIGLSQQQLKLKDDAKVIEDSLTALAKRVFQIQSFVTREVGLMKSYMDESVEAIRQRNQHLAASKQQFAMTSMNNLALLLSDVMKQMQQQMADAKPGKGKGAKGKKQPTPGMGELQQQLNQQIEQLMKSGKGGKELSEELAKLAAQQERIRKAMKEMEKMSNQPGGKQGGGSNLQEMMKQMEKSETDLVNKKITQETINRQKDILTRLLEAEKALKERELDEKRESKTAENLTPPVPPSFEKYLKSKQKQTELLKTIDPTLSPFYKSESNEYFKRF